MEVLTDNRTSNFNHRKKRQKLKLNRGRYPQIARHNKNRVYRDIGKQRRKVVALWLCTWDAPISDSDPVENEASRPWPKSGCGMYPSLLQDPAEAALEAYKPSPLHHAFLHAFSSTLNPNHDVWIHDSGASTHITNDLNSFFRYRPIDGLPTVSTGAGPLVPKGVGYIRARLYRTNGSINEITLENVLYMPTFPINLYSGWLLDCQDGWMKHRVMYNADGSEICQLKRGHNALQLYFAAPPFVTNLHDPSMNPSTFLASSVPSHIFPAAIHEAPVTLELLHRRLGHISFPNVKLTVEHVHGLSYLKQPADDDLDFTRLCDPCEFSKPRKTIRRYPRQRELSYGDRFYTDVFFCTPTGYNNHNCGMIFTDGKTGAMFIYTFAEKGGAYDALVSFTRYFRTQNKFLPKCYRFDGGKEYGGDKIISWCKQYGIAIEPTSANFHEQGGPQERSNRTVLDPMRAVMADMKIPLILWPEIAKAVVYLLNRISTSINDNMTAYEAQSRVVAPQLSDEEHKPDLSHIRVLGSRVLVYIPDERRVQSRKMDLRAEEGILVGFEGRHIFRCWIPSRAPGHNLVRSSHVRFYEGRFREISPEDAFDQAPDDVDISPPAEETPDPSPAEEVSNPRSPRHLDDEALEAPPVRNNLPDEEDPIHQPIEEPIKRPRGRPPGRKNNSKEVDPTAENLALPPRQTRSMTQKGPAAPHIPPSANPIMLMNYHAYIAALETDDDPKSYRAARSSPLSDKWDRAMKEELHALKIMNTYKPELRISVPEGHSVIPCQWVYKTKRGKINEITRYKGRYVAKGFHQEEGIDYTDTYASTAMASHWKALLALAAANNWDVEQMDVITAFLNPDIDKDIWVAWPEGLDTPDGRDPKYWCWKLQKSLYGLKQAPNLWQAKLRSKLLPHGFKPLLLDSSIYFNPSTSTYLVSHVDDFLLIGPTPGVTSLRSILQQSFKMVDLGEADYFVGVRITRNRAERTLSLHQDTYIKKILAKYGFTNTTPRSTPMIAGQHLVSNELQATQEEIDLYSSMVGSASYAAIQTRPDIAYVVSQLSRFVANPSKEHIIAVRHLYHYFAGFIKLGIRFGNGTNQSLHGYTDSDYAQDPETRRSHGGHVYFIKGGCFYWKTYQMKRVTDSSTMAEVYAMAAAAKHAKFVRDLFRSFHYANEDVKTIALYYDNQPGRHLVDGHGITQRSKHFDVPLFMLRELVSDQVVELRWISGLDNPADGFTKALSPVLFKRFVLMLNMHIL